LRLINSINHSEGAYIFKMDASIDEIKKFITEKKVLATIFYQPLHFKE